MHHVVRVVSKAAWPMLLSWLALAIPARAQPVTFADLEGLTVEADVRWEQNIRRQGNPATVRIDQSWRVSLGPVKSVEHTVSTTAHTPRGPRKEEPAFNTFTLEEPKKVQSRGGGEAVWKFADETLTFVRTFPSGAFRLAIAFKRTPSGLTCTGTAGYARENGKGQVRFQSPFGGEVTVISSRPLPSTCKVSVKSSHSGAIGGRLAHGRS